MLINRSGDQRPLLFSPTNAKTANGCFTSITAQLDSIYSKLWHSLEPNADGFKIFNADLEYSQWQILRDEYLLLAVLWYKFI